MDEQVIFTTQNTGTVCNVHSLEQTSLRQLTVGSAHSAVQIGERYLLVAQSQKALINVYDISGDHKRESVEQRIPLPEVVCCLETVQNLQDSPQAADLSLPWLLLASTPSGKLYVWEMNSGFLLRVKQMAHYQSITKIQSICNGKYVVTSGEDSRVIIWQTTDLVCEEEPKPVCILHDHTLSVTDFAVSSTCGDSNVRLFTASQDATLRCYSLNLSRSVEPKQLATFTCPYPIQCLALDPADRACYVGTSQGVFNLSLYYRISGDKISNLIQETSTNKLFSLVPEPQESRDKLYSRGSLQVDKIVEANATRLEVSLDGSLLIVGDNDGHVAITEIFSKQVLRTIQPLTTAASNGAVTNLLIATQWKSSSQPSLTQRHNFSKIPALQRNIHDKRDLHELWFQIGQQPQSNPPQSNFEEYLNQVQAEQMLWSQSSTTPKPSAAPIPTAATSATVTADEDSKDQEIAQLRENLTTLKGAYAELRSMHQTLLEDRQ
ncbi:hypothetical protein ZYGR_0I04060 [Zygosaccharomyces rouxii]|uniref:Pre-rRNA-processing protein IPI3 n=2 Tax=Zygosaccharomyces rouxii TaxID=4956 RepID=C5DTM3_ZYGRC|nr:uncharacterized protein ZYRO0C09724g [Zygosaccharomyces rouxii]KAH9201687.1 WD40-repeat-containing domain protein [Zygosaccharomyces rouxii]GAV48109.1 hypothetical protein ZYGR_0I04060 [Zygosaccharomyces rouxii]CAR27134.1 ZYRO0C09724p [Zygosaccharomyces rouxii]